MATNIDAHSLEQIGRYPVKRFINEGAMAWVFLVSDPNLFDAERALKLLKPVASVGNDLKRFQNEAKLLTKIQHPNLLRVYDFSRDEETGLHFYTMDFIDGEVMSSLVVDTSISDPSHSDSNIDVEKFTPVSDAEKTVAIIDLEKTVALDQSASPKPLASVSVQQACGFFLDVLSALGRLHREDIIHRDIKPQNIFLTRDGIAILGDLGIAKLESDAGMTEVGHVLGTPLYMAPELAMAGKVTICSDIFSLGLSMYRVLTGRTIYADSQELATVETSVVISHLLSLHRDRREFDFDFPDGVPEAVRKVVRIACRMDEAERYQDANEMTLALRSAITDSVSGVGHNVPIRSMAAEVATSLVMEWSDIRGPRWRTGFSRGCGRQSCEEFRGSSTGCRSSAVFAAHGAPRLSVSPSPHTRR